MLQMPEQDMWQDVEPEYDIERERLFRQEYDEQKEIERRMQLDDLRRQVDELKAELLRNTPVDRDEHRLLERFEMLLRGRWISTALATRMVEIIQERARPNEWEERVRALEAQKYMAELEAWKTKIPKQILTPQDKIEKELDSLLKEKEFIEKGEFEL